MRTPAALALAFASAALGSAVTGWTLSTASAPVLSPAVLSNTGYNGPAAAPLGDLAGGLEVQGSLAMANPMSSPADLARGKQLFSAMNCAGCHGYTGAGGMGPPLNDSYWRYGGTAEQIYKSLYEGRPQGMPAWGHALPPDELWRLTAYVQSLSKDQPGPGQADVAHRGDRAVGTTAKSGSALLEGQ